MSVQHTQVFAAEPLIEQAPDLTEEFVQSLTVQGTLPNGQTVQAPEKVTDFIRAQLTALLNHQNIAVNFTPDILTTSEAAELLGLSRPTLAKWADEGRLPSHKAGTHRRFKREDVLVFREQQRAQKRAALHDLLKFQIAHPEIDDE